MSGISWFYFLPGGLPWSTTSSTPGEKCLFTEWFPQSSSPQQLDVPTPYPHYQSKSEYSLGQFHLEMILLLNL
jgi:hypothetical protein